MNSMTNVLVAIFTIGPLFLVNSCAPAPTAREELVRSLKGANVEGFDFALTEDVNGTVSSLTNREVGSLIGLDTIPGLVLQYTRVVDKKANSVKTYKTEVEKKERTIAIVVTDIATGAEFSRVTFPPPQPHAEPMKFRTLQDCIDSFKCAGGDSLQCVANRTCQPQFAALICCLTDGNCFSVHLIFRPTNPLCTLLALVPNFDGLILSD
jgi:hypothetical protein